MVALDSWVFAVEEWREGLDRVAVERSFDWRDEEQEDEGVFALDGERED